eukprot:c5987_g1_i2.p1 GENE.c5987_g1_i2~~c5987_g1_i2.p1  ORF type:complete len:745 (-),score=180.15 c5987_g1_i2:40-2244(-)
MRVVVVIFLCFLCLDSSFGVVHSAQLQSGIRYNPPPSTGLASQSTTIKIVIVTFAAIATVGVYVAQFFISRIWFQLLYMFTVLMAVTSITLLAIVPLTLGNPLDSFRSSLVFYGSQIFLIMALVGLEIHKHWKTRFALWARILIGIGIFVPLVVVALAIALCHSAIAIWIRWKLRDVDDLKVIQSPTLEVQVWANVTDATFVHPELSETEFGMSSLKAKPNFGVAASGGGIRAAAFQLGAFRALRTIGVMDKIRYISSVSGGGWTSAPYIFKRPANEPTGIDDDEFLGPYLPPNECSIEKLLNNTAGSLVYTLSHSASVFETYVAVMLEMTGKKRFAAAAWEQGVAQMVLAPYSLSSGKCIMAVENFTSPALQKLIDQNAGIQVIRVPKDKPFPIFNAVIRDDDDPYRFAPFEFTPLYSGAAVDQKMTSLGVGGFIETVGVTATPTVTTPFEGKLNVTPEFVISVTNAIGTSSSAGGVPMRSLWDSMASSSQQIAWLGMPFFEYWSPIHGYRGRDTAFTDGGGLDNFGLLALLRRQVENVLVLYGTGSDILTDSKETDISRFFGTFNSTYYDVEAKYVNEIAQVFESDGYKRLMDTFKTQSDSGLPMVHKETYTVRENKMSGIKGGWKVKVVWVVNSVVKGWEDALAPDTLEKLQHDRTNLDANIQDFFNKLQMTTTNNVLTSFPLLPTGTLNSELALSLLSQLSSYNLVSVKDWILELAAVSNVPSETSGKSH